MKIAHMLLLVSCFMLALPGCGPQKENQLSTNGYTAEDIAKYEADLAATEVDAGYDEELDNEPLAPAVEPKPSE